MCKTSITCNNNLFSQRKNSPADKQTYLYRLRIDQIASETIQPELYSICSIRIMWQLLAKALLSKYAF